MPPSNPLLLLRTHSSFAAIYIPSPHSHTRGRSPDPACAAAINSAAARVQRGIRQPADSSERQATASGSLSGQRREEDRSHTLAHDTLTAHSQGFNFCDGAPLTGGERLELCYFPAALGIRSFAGGDGETEPIDPCFEANFARVRWQLETRCSPLPLSSTPCDRAPQDPHLSLPRGGRADFRGRDGQYYCFLSAPRLAINIKTEDATFRLHNLYDEGGTLVVDGSFLTEVHFVARVGGRKNKLCLASFWASEFKCDARG